jgi:site-specific recombinase XerC
MGTVYKRKGRKCYYIAWLDEHGKRREKKAFRDKGLSQRELLKMEDEVERVKAGAKRPEERYKKKPLEECWDAYLADIKTRGLTNVYHAQVRKQLERVQGECGWEVLGDISAESLRGFLNSLVEKGRGPRTCNLYRDAVGTFCCWAMNQSPAWLADNPVAAIPKARNQRGKKTRARRAYTLEEFRRLTTCESIPEWRRFLYLLAGLSGLRKRTLYQLQKMDCTPEGDRPTWHVRPEIIKTGWKSPIPMLPECAEAILAKWKGLSSSSARFFKAELDSRCLRRDLERAKIAKKDEQGRSADFHSLRYFFCTLLAKSLPIQKVRVLMMHRDARTTLNLYTDLGLIDVGEDVWALPRLLPGVAPARKGQSKKK